MKEKSRSTIHSEDILQVGKIHEQISELQITAKNNYQNIEKLLPLVTLIPSIEDIVENQRATALIGRKILKWIAVISAILGLLYLIFRFWKEVK
jgi:hypothetical protein